MKKPSFGRLLVIGENPDQLCALYAEETKVEPYVSFKFEDREVLRQGQLKKLERILNSEAVKSSEELFSLYSNLYQDTLDMDGEEFYESITEGMTIDDKTGDAYTDENPNAKYKFAKCYDSILKKTGEEGPFSNPFILIDGTRAYIARNSEIDWSKNHMYNTEIYKAAWEVCVDGRKPKNETEELIQKNMQNRQQYFSNFKNADEYVRHSCCFWTNCIITEDGVYHGLEEEVSDMVWVAGFYDRFIKPLPENALLTLYEYKTLN